MTGESAASRNKGVKLARAMLQAHVQMLEVVGVYLRASKARAYRQNKLSLTLVAKLLNHVKGNPVINSQHFQHDARRLSTEVELSASPAFALENQGTRGYLAHTALLGRDSTVLGCIDTLQKNAELIRLDGGLHWTTFGSDALPA